MIRSQAAGVAEHALELLPVGDVEPACSRSRGGGVVGAPATQGLR